MEDNQSNPEDSGDRVSIKKSHVYSRFMENFDRVGSRVCLAFPIGLVVGASYGTLSGSAILSPVLASAASCTMLATACFGSERIFYACIPRPFPYFSGILEGKEDFMSHTLGGAFGGSCVGWLYRGRPLSGALLFTPLMIGVAFAERKLKQQRLERLEYLISQLEKK